MPFRAAIAAGVAGIMTGAHPGPGARRGAPGDAVAARSSSGLLKEKLGFEGVVFTDDIEHEGDQRALRDGGGNASRAIAAGCDVVLMCGDSQEPQFAAIETLIHAVEDGTLPLKRVEDALARHRRMKERFLAPPRPVPLDGSGAADAARPRRASGRGRRNGAVCVLRQTAGPAPGRSDRHRRARQRRSRRAEFDAGVDELRQLGFEPVYERRVFARDEYLAGAGGPAGA